MHRELHRQLVVHSECPKNRKSGSDDETNEAPSDQHDAHAYIHMYASSPHVDRAREGVENTTTVFYKYTFVQLFSSFFYCIYFF